MKYVLENEIERKQCIECLGMWIKFHHGTQIGVYRLSPVAPCDCSVCDPIDQDIESQSIVSFERWFNRD